MGSTGAQSVQGWHLVAADAARLLDPTVPVPSRLETMADQRPSAH